MRTYGGAASAEAAAGLGRSGGVLLIPGLYVLNRPRCVLGRQVHRRRGAAEPPKRGRGQSEEQHKGAVDPPAGDDGAERRGNPPKPGIEQPARLRKDGSKEQQPAGKVRFPAQRQPIDQRNAGTASSVHGVAHGVPQKGHLRDEQVTQRGIPDLLRETEDREKGMVSAADQDHRGEEDRGGARQLLARWLESEVEN